MEYNGSRMLERGVISPMGLFNIIGEHKNDKLIHKLISFRYIDEKPIEINGNKSTYYKLSERGYGVFDPWYKKTLRFFTNDLAKILSLIAIILSIIATVISLISN